MNEAKIMTASFLCKRQVEVGPHRYEGRNVPAWGIFIYDTCRNANWDGIVPTTYPHLIEYLKSKATEIEAVPLFPL